MRPRCSRGRCAHARHRHDHAAPPDGRRAQAIVRLFTERGGITLDGSYFKLHDAHLQVSEAFSATAHADFRGQHDFSVWDGGRRPTWMRCIVGRVLCARGSRRSDETMGHGEETATENGKTVDRRNWRLVFPVHLAESRDEALRDIHDGANRWIQDYFINTLGARLQFEEYPNQPVEEMTIDRMIGRGASSSARPTTRSLASGNWRMPPVGSAAC